MTSSLLTAVHTVNTLLLRSLVVVLHQLHFVDIMLLKLCVNSSSYIDDTADYVLVL